MRRIVLLKDNWQFKKVDSRKWTTVRIPHDFAARENFDRDSDISYSIHEIRGKKVEVERPGNTGGLPFCGKFIYRREVEIDSLGKDEMARLEFDGVMSHAEVYCNGVRVGGNSYGYSPFACNLTGVLKKGKNLITVEGENYHHMSRWYPGGGIYRDVRLVIFNETHIIRNGVKITTEKVSEESAEVHFRVAVHDFPTEKKEVALEAELLAPDGKVIGKFKDQSTVWSFSYKYLEYQGCIPVKNPKLWDIETPIQYSLRLKLKRAGKPVDELTVPFGIRSIRLEQGKGFLLNEKPIVFKGVCLHHDLGPLGAAFNKSLLRERFKLLKEMGCNAIRTSHNPAASGFLDLCDEMGFVVIEEAFDKWETGPDPDFVSYAETSLREMIQRDWNRPSVIMWSIGNEVGEHDAANVRMAHKLAGITRAEDPTRPVTVGCCGGLVGCKNGFADAVDVVGFNYHLHMFPEIHELHPEYFLMATESASTVSSNGEYYFPVGEERPPCRKNLQVNGYDLAAPPWGVLPDMEFGYLDHLPYALGEFVWTGFDYLGETTPYDDWPARSSYFGINDLAGFPKDRFYLYQSRWSPEKETLHLLPHWTWPGREGEITPVHCYTSFRYAELFVNGKSQGVREKSIKPSACAYRLIWDEVRYEPGELKVVAYDDKFKPVKEEIVRTAEEPYAVVAIPSKKTFEDDDDMIFVEVRIVDRNGNRCPDASDRVEFKVTGGAELAACGNGDATSLEPFAGTGYSAFHGLCAAYLRPSGKGGKFTFTAEAKNLKKAVFQGK